ncbi:hypothetical protein [Ahrensia sp. R2A130]|uniref:hypothetical protein n=1 Tax=Ahrensia sp. R2A130 TaxID=744979 RepID=UPI0001E0F8A5|nr:hypothetical protein [Ahrensia sp. R2A130]EFL89042.1 conserved hypothetical protein [Ahrensia sp. R2A130]
MSSTDKSDDDAKPVELSGPSRSLKASVEKLRSRNAEREDAKTGRLAAERLRLENLADELRPVFEEVDPNDDRFEFTLVAGSRPRLWVDQTAFVAIGRDGRTYRMFKDTRNGRVVLAEIVELESMADIVSEYIAERVIARETMIESDVVPLRILREADTAPTRVNNLDRRAEPNSPAPRRLGWFLFGAIASLLGTIAAVIVYSSAAF